MRRSYISPFGAQSKNGKTDFRLWAPGAAAVDLVIEGGSSGPQGLPLVRGKDGLFQTEIGRLPAGTLYRYRIDGGLLVPDPASRFQPEDVHGPSEVVDPEAYSWEFEDWTGRPWAEQVVYELHPGTFTREGTFAAAAEKLSGLADLGITAVELMPVSDFPGKRNWGYDGVLPYAPDSSYGRPEDLKRLIDTAHSLGLCVFLDVVYNHFGPEGNYLWTYCRDFFTSEVSTPWGDAIDFRRSQVRDFFIHNAVYWLEEYFFDGLRLDAVHAIHDPSPEHFLSELARRIHERFDGKRLVHLVLENDQNQARYMDPGRGGGYSAQWNDDFHHVVHHVATGETHGYYADFAGKAVPLLRKTLSEGFYYQGRPSAFRGGRIHGEKSAHLPPSAFVNFLQNHDQIGNRAFGNRLTELADPAKLEMLICLQCLAPQIPLLFMGEEWGTKTPFLYFCDFHDELAAAVRDGRRKEFSTFPEFRDPASRALIPDPNAEDTRGRSCLVWDEQKSQAGQKRLELYRTLLSLRRQYSIGGAKTPENQELGGGPENLLVLGWRLADGSLWTLVCNPGQTEAVLPDRFCLKNRKADCRMVFSHPRESAFKLESGRVSAFTTAVFHEEN